MLTKTMTLEVTPIDPVDMNSKEFKDFLHAQCDGNEAIIQNVKTAIQNHPGVKDHWVNKFFDFKNHKKDDRRGRK